MNKKIIIILLAAVGVVAFAGVGAWFFSQSQKPAGNNFGRDSMRMGAPINGDRPGSPQAGRRLNSNFATAGGKVSDKDDKSITIALEKGGSKIAFYSDVTRISKATTISAGDLVAGQMVIARGTKNDDGSIAAVSLQVRPANQSATGDAADQKNSVLPDTAKNMPLGVQNPGGGGQGNGGFVNGQITAVNGSNITLKLPDNSPKAIVVSTDTKFTKIEDAKIEDVAKDTEVTVMGSKGSDGSIVAQSIMIGGSMMAPPMGAGQQPGQMPR